MSEILFPTAVIRDYLRNGEVAQGVIRAATDLQQLFSELLFFKKGIKFELIDRWGLGELTKWNIVFGHIAQKNQALLDAFAQLRNLVFHRRTIMEKILKNKQHMQIVTDLTLSICELIDRTKIDYQSSEEIEIEYREYLKAIEEKYGNLLSKLYNNFSELEGKNEL
ncbi:hypothetical protein J4423_05725 [Candidatus Pacearchaeota archaeon]|nr:hypothetical protein [Candidatus Pacearchaeota archaeon]